MSSVSLWLALSPKQFADLNAGKDVHPDEHSGRFGFRRSAGAAVDRAQYFNDWTPDGLKGEYHQKDYVVLEVEFTVLGYLNKMEEDVGSDSAPSAPSGSAPSAPPKRKAPGADDGVTGAAAALTEARSTLAQAKANDEALRQATEQRLKEAAERRATEQHIKAAADRLPGHPEMEDDEEQAVLLPRALLHRLADLTKALQHQGCLNERYMKQSKDDLEKWADLYQTIKVPSEMSLRNVCPCGIPCGWGDLLCQRS
eukprot:s23_g56.t1